MQFDMLKLDFGREQVIYEGKTFPTGAIAVAALNMDQTIIDQMEPCCNALKSFRGAFNRGKVTEPLLISARQRCASSRKWRTCLRLPITRMLR